MLRRNDRGVVLPTRLLALSISAVAAGVLVYLVNDPDQPANDQATPTVTRSSPSPTPTPTATAVAKAKPKAPVIRRGKTLVEIFNNTRTKGLAGRTSATAQAAGWHVVGTDNWYGTVDGTTVYYPPKYEAAARALGRDLGIKKIKPAEDPLRFDRITVILTDDYAG
jgi:LytR cell envelope-related transcriptional attenuator